MEDKQIFDMWEEYKNLLRSTKREGIEGIIKWLDETDFKFAPASTQYHNSFKGGLLKHSLDVYYHMYDFANLIQFFNISKETAIITSLLHDICKVNCYKTDFRNTKDEKGNWIKVPYYSWDEQEPLGHAEKSIMLIYEYGSSTTINKIERAMIRNHMGFSEQEKMSMVSHLFSKCPQALVLHFADMLASYTTESKDLQDRFKKLLLGRNINECLQKSSEKTKIETINIDNIEYKVAPIEAEVDDKNIIYVNYNNRQVKVYAPYGDGLPF